MLKKGSTLVELALAMGIIGIIGVGAANFLTQSLTVRAKSWATSEATDTAQAIIDRVDTSVKKAVQLRVTGSGTILQATGTVCEVFSLQTRRVYYDVSANEICPSPTTNTPLHRDSTEITNLIAPSVPFFTGSPDDNDPESITIKIRASVPLPLATSEVFLQQTIVKRR